MKELDLVLISISLLAAFAFGWGLTEMILAPTGGREERRGKRIALVAGPIALVAFIAWTLLLTGCAERPRPVLGQDDHRCYGWYRPHRATPVKRVMADGKPYCEGDPEPGGRLYGRRIER